ncbi:MAG: response regulator YycF [Bacillota bacterium]|jgi:two-component system response regulator VicR|nr:response regulator transcription factor [Bacillota bacterium]HOC07185.1 response regulator YycF [Bacillota bacterium]HPZ22968.1 response regulator YycF [Bacillota bacterium]HQD20551.1 response regulator YycF [Bacillota bacterium]
MARAYKILIVEDEKPIADILEYNLEKEGYEVRAVYRGDEAVEAATEFMPDLILLDIMLPGIDGLSVCRQVRQHMDCPIIMLTAKDAEIDKVLGLELGADDYVTKPFSTRELLARIKAQLRGRAFAVKEKQASQAESSLEIDRDFFTVKRKGKVIDLTQREFELLDFMASHPGKIFSREELLKKVWGYDYYGDVRTVDVTIRRLRVKIEENPGNPQYILSRRGLGYYFKG